MDTKVSNCITEIPQDIKLELNNGTLTLKAGSKVYVPNGFESDGTTNKFDVKIIGQDLTVTFDNTRQKGVIISPNNTMVHGNLADHFISSSTAPSISWGYWYDLTNNQIKWTNDGTTWISGYSLPICIATGTKGSVTSIDQVFNGFGYIGSTVFALPGVKGLIPNGRNADGSLKSIEFTVNNVLTITQTSDRNYYITLNSNSIAAPTYSEFGFDEENNYITFNNTKINLCNAGNITYSNGKITSFTPKTVFHALDYNDKSTISGWSMPSSRYIDLTLGSSDTFYIAPANGYFYFRGAATDADQYIDMENLTSKYSLQTNAPAGRIFCTQIIPARKDDMVRISYTVKGKIDGFRFIYAEGE